MSLSEILHKLQRRTWSERRLLPEALLWLAVMRLTVLLAPFQRTAGILGLAQESSPLPLPDSQQTAIATTIGWAVRVMAARTPWASTCLTQALAGMIMLQRRGIPAQLFLGVAKDVTVPENVAAHAWLKCGHLFLTGECENNRFTVIAAFAGKHCS